jgi:hypothetical protein
MAGQIEKENEVSYKGLGLRSKRASRREKDIVQWKVQEDQKGCGNELSLQSDFRHP